MNPDTVGRIRTNQAPEIGTVFLHQLKAFLLKFERSFGMRIEH
jgi:hypothetical protein